MRALINETANAQTEIANKLILNARERVLAEEKLVALRAAQQIDPTFDPSATGRNQGNRAARAKYDEQINLQELQRYADLLAQLRSQFANAVTGAILPSDDTTLQRTAELMRDTGVTADQVSAAFGSAARNAQEYYDRVKKIADAKDTGRL